MLYEKYLKSCDEQIYARLISAGSEIATNKAIATSAAAISSSVVRFILVECRVDEGHLVVASPAMPQAKRHFEDEATGEPGRHAPMGSILVVCNGL